MKNDQGWFRRGVRTVATVPVRRRARPELLVLEDRQMLSVIPVTSADDSGQGTLRDAVAQANAAKEPVEIQFHLNGTETIRLTSGQLELSNASYPVAIEGPGADRLTIDGTGKSRVFQIDSGVTASITGMTLANGTAGGNYGYGGDLSNNGTLTLTGVVVRGGTAGYLGGDLFNSGTAALVDCTITDGTANRGAGLFNSSSGTATLKDCLVTGNTGVAAFSELSSLGGGVFNWGSLSMTGGSITGDSATVGSALYSAGPASLTGTTIRGNPSATDMIFNNGVPLTLVDCTISGDSSTSNGGFGINAFYYTGQVDLIDCTIEGFLHGGITNTGSTLNMTGCRIINNSGRGGLENRYWDSNSTLTDCTISGNTGGGINSNGTVTLTGCTMSDNTSPGRGGALYIGGQGTLTDCTISGNAAAQGGGIASHGPLNLVACTVSGNSATTAGGGGGLYIAASTATLTDTIVAGNTAPNVPSDIAGAAAGLVAGSYNLIGTGGSGGLKAADHNLLGVANPGLTPLGDYGGPTSTMALQPNSPARHNGIAVSGVTTDQRGFPLDRPVDIGAFQSQPGPLVVDAAIDGLGSPPGRLSLRQAVNLADVLTGGATITFDRSAFAKPSVIALTAGQLELSNATGPIKVLGPGLDRLAISGGGSSRVFQVNRGVSAALSGLTITGGVTPGDGGGLLNRGTVALVGVAVVDNAAANGGGVANAGTAVIFGSAIDGNSASAEGGGIFNTGALALTLSDLSGNAALTHGGGLFNRGTAALVFCNVDGNSASAGGGVFADPSGSPVVLIGTKMTHNKGGNTFGRVIRL